MAALSALALSVGERILARARDLAVARTPTQPR
jgi:hypothetical protein